jgi:hypothetical protein
LTEIKLLTIERDSGIDVIDDVPEADRGHRALPSGSEVLARITRLNGRGNHAGLASRGVAVLRFDKVTHAHRAELATATGFTIDDEYVHHAVAAPDLLRTRAAVDPRRLFVLPQLRRQRGTVGRRLNRSSQACLSRMHENARPVLRGGGAEMRRRYPAPPRAAAYGIRHAA